MPKKKYLVTLEDDERQQLEDLLHSGTHATRKVTRARILLKAAEGWEDNTIAAALSVGRATVERLRQRFVEEGLGALEERPRPGAQSKLDAKAEARLIAEACSAAPEGRQRWTFHLLADRVVALGLAASYSYESVRRVLKKRSSSRGCRNNGASQKSGPSSSPRWKMSWRSTRSPMILLGPRSTLMRRPSNSFKRPDNRCQPSRGDCSAMIMNMSGTARAISFSSWNPRPAGGMCR